MSDRVIEYSDLLGRFSLLKEKVFMTYPDATECLIHELPNPWGWSALAEVTILFSGSCVPQKVRITYFGEVCTLCEKMRTLFTEWLESLDCKP